MDQVLLGHPAQDVEVTKDQGVLGDEADRLLELGGDLQTAPGQPVRPLGGLVAVGDSRDGNRLALPALPREEFPQ